MADNDVLIGFWVDNTHKVRLIKVDADTSPTLLNDYCKHLDEVFKPRHYKTFRLFHENQGNTSSALVDTDTNEFLLWAASR